MLDRLLHTMPFVMLLRSMQRLDIRCPCGMPEVWDRDSVATAGTEYTIVCSAIALTTRGKKPLERSQHLITRLVRETEMRESLRDFGGRVSAVTAGGVMISTAHPETLRRSRVAQVPYWNGVTLPTSALRIRQPGTKPGGQTISFSLKLLSRSTFSCIAIRLVGNANLAVHSS
jgi:hypothetical protein